MVERLAPRQVPHTPRRVRSPMVGDAPRAIEIRQKESRCRHDTLNQSDTQDLSITVSAALTITTPSLPDAEVGKSYNKTLARSGGVAPFTWSVTPSLPSGLNLNESTGQITGTPEAGTAGTYSLTFTVEDSSTPTSQTASKLLELKIKP